MTQQEWNQLLASKYAADTAVGVAQELPENIEQEETLAQQKAKRLAQATVDKINRLGEGYTPDTLIGIEDADTMTTKNVGYARSIDPYGRRYDANEIPHKGEEGIDLYGRDGNWFTNLFHSGPSKSTYAMQRQREATAKIFNKSPDDVTEQDVIDLGRQQKSFPGGLATFL